MAWRRVLRMVMGSLLLALAGDYFLWNPARVDPARLDPPPAELAPLAERLRAHVRFLASPELQGRAPGSPGNKAAADYIVARFRESGLAAPWWSAGEMAQQVHEGIGDNVFAALPSPSPERDWLLLGAHFDHLGLAADGRLRPGADDNASGVAIMIEVMRALREQGHVWRHNVLFAGFNAEEPPYFLTALMGSNRFFAGLRAAGIAPARLRLAVIMDIMGGVAWKPIQDTVFVMGAEKLPETGPLLDSLIEPGLKIAPLGLHMVETVPGIGQMMVSDYQVFRENAAPFLFLSSGRTPHYHRDTDTAETLHYPRMARTARWLARFLREIDGRGQPLRYERAREDYARDLATLAGWLDSAARWETKIPRTSLWSLWRLREDAVKIRAALGRQRAGMTPLPADALAMHVASIRVQCLLGSLGPCALIGAGVDF